jgi:hypothetical protein
MTVPNLGLFFPPRTRVLALPNWQHPRLYLPAQRFSQRWVESAFYPASRLGARLHRLLLRITAVAGMAEVRTVTSSDWTLGEFTEKLLPEVDSAAILVSRTGRAQKVTVQLRDERGVVLGYLKHAGQGVARRGGRWRELCPIRPRCGAPGARQRAHTCLRAAHLALALDQRLPLLAGEIHGPRALGAEHVRGGPLRQPQHPPSQRRHRRVVPVAALIGAVFLIWADVVARVAFSPRELPLGIVTAVVGAPFLFTLVRRFQAGTPS